MTNDPVPPLRISDVCGILAVVPYLMGFQPADSMVIITVSGKRITLTSRIDLGLAVDGIADLARASQNVEGDALIVIGYSDRLDAEFAEMVERFAQQLLAACGSSFEIFDVVAVAPAENKYRDLSTGEEGDYGDTRYDRAAAEMVGLGRSACSSREALLEGLLPGTGMIPAGFGTTFAYSMNVLAAWSNADIAEATVQGLGEAFEAETPRGETLGALAALVTCDAGRVTALSAITAENAETHFELWTEVVRITEDMSALGPLGLAGIAAWQAGLGASMNAAGENFASLLERLGDKALPDKWMLDILRLISAASWPPSKWPDLLKSIVELREHAAEESLV